MRRGWAACKASVLAAVEIGGREVYCGRVSTYRELGTLLCGGRGGVAASQSFEEEMTR